jgi:cytoskeleton protein RodZ
MTEAGRILKQAREQKNLSLHEIGMSLKINPKTLQAIEDGDISKLPPKTFLRGFIKSYAQYLKLDPVKVLQASDPVVSTVLAASEMPRIDSPVDKEAPAAPPKETSKSEEPAAPIAPMAPRTSAEALPLAVTAADRTTRLDPLKAPAHTPRKGVYIALILGLLLTIGAIIGQVKKYQRDAVVHKPDVPVTAVNTSAPAGTSATVDETPIVPSVVGGALPLAADKSAEPSKEQKAAVGLTDEPKAESSKPAEPVAPLAKAQTAVVAKAPENAELATKPQEVILEALNNVHIVFSLGDGKIESVDLSADEIHTFKSSSLIHLEINDGGSVNIIVNGRERGIPGKIGKPLVLNYPK